MTKTMTHMKTLAVLLLAGTMLTAGATFAARADDDGPGARERDRAAHGFRMGERFARADADGDRMLSLEEFRAGAAERFTLLDADGDGLVTAAELASELQRRTQERAAQRLAHIDADGDGALSLEEMTAASEARFARMDRDEDGSVEPRELRRGMRGERGERGDDHRGRHGEQQGQQRAL